MVSSPARIMPITQPRTLRNLIHSARSREPKPPPRGPSTGPGFGPRHRDGLDSSSRHLLRRVGVGSRPGGTRRLLGELHIGLLQGVARCAETSENGTASPPSSATIRSAASPEIVSTSWPLATTVAPAFSSTAFACGRSDVRSVTRSPDAAASRLAHRGVGDNLAAADDHQVIGGVLQLAHEMASTPAPPARWRPASARTRASTRCPPGPSR